MQPYLCTPARLVFLDESGFNTAMARPYGRAHRTQRAVDQVPRNWGRNQTLICAMHAGGTVAPLVVEGAVNGPIFEWYVREVLCPALTPGQLVILDNLSAHHREAVRTLIEERACTLLFLPPSSPDFNPIEFLFSKLKALVRAARCRVLPALLSGIWQALERVTLADLFAWITHVYPSALLCQML